jgi:hypothetical protein
MTTSPLRACGGAQNDTDGNGSACVWREGSVLSIEPEQILTLHVEHQDPHVGCTLSEQLRSRREETEEEERERGLRRHPGDPGDRHVAALASVEEVEIDEHRLAVAADPDGQRASHLVDVQGPVPLVAVGPLDDFTRVRRHPQFGIDPGHRHPGGANLGAGEDALGGDAMSVGLVLRTLVHGFGLGDHAVGADLSVLGHLGADDHEIVELQVFVVVEHDPKLARRGVLGAEHTPHPVVHGSTFGPVG